MKHTAQLFILFILWCMPGLLIGQSTRLQTMRDNIVSDYRNFYALNNLWKLGLGIGYAGFHANTSFDQEIQDFYYEYFKSATSDNIAKVVKPFGDGRITVPIYLTAILIGELASDSKCGSTLGEWGQKTLRGIIVGAPPVLTLQILLGASRPEEGKGSHWHPFKDNNGASGHSFMGAVPFLVAAKMSRNKIAKYLFYLCSPLTGLSRINDNKHYYSQFALGWWIAFLSVESIQSKSLILTPAVHGIGVMFYF